MSRCIESIKLLDGNFSLLPYHNDRMNHTRKSLFDTNLPIHLEEHLIVPEYARRGLFKCRVVYGRSIEHIEYIAYKRRNIQTLKLVHDDYIDYSFKFEDRSHLNRLFAQREGCDDIMIIKNARVTDTSYCNILFFDGRQWVTPLYPLLPGTRRQKLLDEKKIIAKEIFEKDIKSFTYFWLINALSEFNMLPPLPLQKIIF